MCRDRGPGSPALLARSRRAKLEAIDTSVNCRKMHPRPPVACVGRNVRGLKGIFRAGGNVVERQWFCGLGGLAHDLDTPVGEA
jgi:hypothetical protein